MDDLLRDFVRSHDYSCKLLAALDHERNQSKKKIADLTKKLDEIPQIENYEYYQFVYDTFTCGIICGLQHPIEWAVNIHRTPGASFKPDFYQYVEKHLPRFLCLLYDLFNMSSPQTAKDVLNMCDLHYQDNTFCQGYFDFLENQIDQYILTKENSHN